MDDVKSLIKPLRGKGSDGDDNDDDDPALASAMVALRSNLSRLQDRLVVRSAAAAIEGDHVDPQQSVVCQLPHGGVGGAPSPRTFRCSSLGGVTCWHNSEASVSCHAV